MATAAVRAAGDLVSTGDDDQYTLLRQMGSVNERFLETIEATEVPGIGCIVRTTTILGSGTAMTSSESTVFVPSCKIVSDVSGGFKLAPADLIA